ncbi:THO complex subunit 4A-like [Impatiens glandulifera]|uniref:THO complex subunit 4A-like n=1 Tax=Impatiens glandulifera TaxID=253017 RepID=UPI001FB04C9B|nr:THO complex subunit 4A-like [Impatiens glandulifera]
MSRRLDMSLDDLIKSNSQSRGPSNRNPRVGKGLEANRGHGTAPAQSYGSGPARRMPSVAPARSTPYPLPQMLQFEQMPPPGGKEAELGSKIYISNLGYDVSNEDLKMLFSEVGQLKDHSIHYDKSGKSKGTAEVIYFSQSDALAAIRKYNNIQLDGKAMQIHMVGVDIVPPQQPTLLHTSNGILANPNDGILGRPPPPGAYERRWNNNNNNNYSNGNGGGSGRVGRGGNGRVVQKKKEKVCCEDLDADLDKYHSEGLKRKEEDNSI